MNEHAAAEADASPPPAARLTGVTKRFGAVVALDRVRFELVSGEIHGLLGENGAGKTTLARVLAGLSSPDEGRIEIAGRPVRLRNAADARRLGVAMVHQHFSLVPRFTGFENVALFNEGAWTARGTAARGCRDQAEARADELGLAVDLDMRADQMSVGQRQRIEILKALMSYTHVLLLDEPTAVLAPQEAESLLEALRQVARSGTGVVLVAHKLDEALSAADRVTVLRRGTRVLVGPAREFSARELAVAMVGEHAGRDRFSDKFPLESDGRKPGGVVASLEDVAAGRPEAPALRGATLVARSGEVLGVAGVEGNGQRELAAVLAGALRPLSGVARVPSKPGWMPLDRGEEGLVGDFPLDENVALALHGEPAFRRGPWLDWAGIKKRTKALLAAADVKAPGPEAFAATLSGGNQQRLLVARELDRSKELLIAESPTRGLDVKAARAVRRRLAEFARTGEPPPAVVLISSDLDEVLELADRIVVLVRGRLTPVGPAERSATAIGELMLAAKSAAEGR